MIRVEINKNKGIHIYPCGCQPRYMGANECALLSGRVALDKEDILRTDELLLLRR